MANSDFSLSGLTLTPTSTYTSLWATTGSPSYGSLTPCPKPGSVYGVSPLADVYKYLRYQNLFDELIRSMYGYYDRLIDGLTEEECLRRFVKRQQLELPMPSSRKYEYTLVDPIHKLEMTYAQEVTARALWSKQLRDKIEKSKNELAERTRNRIALDLNYDLE